MKKLLITILLLLAFIPTTYAKVTDETGKAITLTQTTDGYMVLSDAEKSNVDNLKKHTVVVMQLESDIMYRATGIAIDKRHILTVDHITSALSKNFYLEKEGATSYWATVIKQDPLHDLSLLEIDKNAPDLINEPMTFAKDITLNESVYTVGHPKSELYSITHGTINSVAGKDLDGIQGIELDIQIKSGNSGGFVINAQGEIVGMIFSRQNMIGNMAFMIGKDDIQKFILGAM
jgi:S1-C subfamily serine protease